MPSAAAASPPPAGARKAVAAAALSPGGAALGGKRGSTGAALPMAGVAVAGAAGGAAAAAAFSSCKRDLRFKQQAFGAAAGAQEAMAAAAANVRSPAVLDDMEKGGLDSTGNKDQASSCSWQSGSQQELGGESSRSKSGSQGMGVAAVILVEPAPSTAGKGQEVFAVPTGGIMHRSESGCMESA